MCVDQSHSRIWVTSTERYWHFKSPDTLCKKRKEKTFTSVMNGGSFEMQDVLNLQTEIMIPAFMLRDAAIT